MFNVKKEIIDTINRVCVKDAAMCCFRYCQINGECAKPHFSEKAERPDKNFMLIRRVNEILGQDILEHNLVVGNEKAKLAIRSASSIKAIIEILNKRHKKKFGREKSLPKGKYHYWKYKDENKNPRF